MPPVDTPVSMDPPQQYGNAFVAPKQEELSHEGRLLRAALGQQYSVDAFEERGIFGERFYTGRACGTEARPVFIKVLPSDEAFPGLLDKTKALIQLQLPQVFAPREAFDVVDVGTVFIFDAPMCKIMTLREHLHKMHVDCTEDIVAKMFAPVVVALFELERKGLLPPNVCVDARTLLFFEDWSARLIHPVMFVHGTYDHHRHRVLEGHEKKVEKKEAKLEKQHEKQMGGAAAAREPVSEFDAFGQPVRDSRLTAEKEELSQRFLAADLGMILYEIMFRSEAHKVSTKMIRDAKSLVKKAQKNARARYSLELSELLLELLQNGKTEKHDVITLQDLISRPIMQRFIERMAADTLHNESLDASAKQRALRRMSDVRGLPRVFPQSHQEKYEKERKNMVEGKRQRLSKLLKKPVEKKRGIRFDVPLEQRQKRRVSSVARKRDLGERRDAQLRDDQRGMQGLAPMPQRGVGRKFRVTHVMPHQEFRHALEHGRGALRQRLRRRRDFAAERRRMVTGVGCELGSLRRGTIQARSGMRFDIPFGEGVSADKRDFRAERKRMVAGEGHRLSPLKSEAIEKKRCARIDVAIDASRELQAMPRESSARIMEVCGLGEREPQEYHQIGKQLPLYASEEREAYGGTNLGGIEQQTVGGGDAALATQKKEPLHFITSGEALPDQGLTQPQQDTSRSDEGMAKNEAPGTREAEMLAERPIIKQGLPIKSSGAPAAGSIPTKLSERDQAEYEAAFGKKKSLADDTPLPSRSGEERVWWEGGDDEFAKAGPRKFGRSALEKRPDKQSMARSREDRRNAAQERIFGRKRALGGNAEDIPIASKSNDRAWWDKGDGEQQQFSEQLGGLQSGRRGPQQTPPRASAAPSIGKARQQEMLDAEIADRPLVKQG